MGELQSEEFQFLSSGDGNVTDPEHFLDLSSLADIDHFEDCHSWQWEDEKERSIKSSLENKSGSTSFRELCFSRGGLLKDEFRRKTWPLIVAASTSPEKDKNFRKCEEEIIQNHEYYNQVVMDVKRILKRFPPGIDEVIQADLQIKVTHLIIKVLMKNSEMHYYQGFHDVAITLLLVLGEEMSYDILSSLTESHFHLYMRQTMEPAMEILNLVYILIKKKNHNLYDYLMRSELGTICFLPWVITWFGHVINDYNTVVRLFDVFLCSHEYAPIYLSAAIVLYRADEVLMTPCDMPLIHHMLSNIPEDLPLEDLILDAEKMMELYPPDSMKLAIQEMHHENLLKAQQEEDERRKRFLARKALPPIQNNPFFSWKYYWIGLRQPLRSPTVKYVALSVSVATMAWIFTYIRPNIDGLV